jgi:hypothetical protein
LKQTNRIQVFWSAYFSTSSSIGSQNLDFRDTQLFLFLHWTIKPDSVLRECNLTFFHTQHYYKIKKLSKSNAVSPFLHCLRHAVTAFICKVSTWRIRPFPDTEVGYSFESVCYSKENNPAATGNVNDYYN